MPDQLRRWFNLVGAVATAAVAGAFALVAGAEEVSVFAAEVGVDEAGAVC